MKKLENIHIVNFANVYSNFRGFRFTRLKNWFFKHAKYFSGAPELPREN